MKILKLSSYCYPEQISSSHLAKDMNEAYEKAGFFCEIHTPTPTRGIDEETRKKYKKIKYEELNNGYIQIHRFSMFREPKNSLLRAFRYTLCIIANFFNGLCAKDIDVYYASSTPPINGLIMSLLKKFKKFKIVFGNPSNEIYETDEHGEKTTTPFVFRYGRGVGLKNNSRTPKLFTAEPKKTGARSPARYCSRSKVS